MPLYGERNAGVLSILWMAFLRFFAVEQLDRLVGALR